MGVLEVAAGALSRFYLERVKRGVDAEEANAAIEDVHFDATSA